MTNLKPLLIFVLLFFSNSLFAQTCIANYSIQSGSLSGEKLFVDNSMNATSITMNTPGATPASSTFLPGETISVTYPSSGSYSTTYIVSNAATSCSDTIISWVQVCLIDPPIVTLSANPGEFTISDPALDTPGEYGFISFSQTNPASNTISGNQSLSYSTNTAVWVSNSNGPHAFWYFTDNGTGSCYDSILVSFDINTVTSCQAGIAASPMTWVSAGTFYLLDQSTNNSIGTFNCAGASPSTVVFDPWNGVVSTTIEFMANGSYPYTYVTYDSISNCSDTVSGVIYVSSIPCNTQAGLIITPGSNAGEYTITDNSTNAANGTFYSSNASGTQLLPSGGSTSIEYTSNGWHSYSYVVLDSTGVCSDSIVGYIEVNGLACPPMNPVQWSTTSTPGEIIFEDPTYNGIGEAKVFFLDASNNLINPGYLITQGNTTTVNISANGTYIYSYRIYNDQINCSDSIIDTLVVNSFTGCQAGLTYSAFTLGGIHVFDQSTNVQQGQLYCAGASPQTTTITVNPFQSYLTDGLLYFSANGTYPYTYITENTTTGCSDTITGVFVITGLPTPCNVQAGLNVAPGSGLGDHIISDVSTGGAAVSYFNPGNGMSPIQLLPSTSITVNYPANGTYSYEYIVTDTSGTCSDTLLGTISVSGYPLPCSTQAGLTITPGSNAGEYTITDNSTNAANGTFYSTNTSGVVTLSSGGSSSVDYASNGWHYYMYVVVDSAGGCADTMNGSVYVSGVNCGLTAGLVLTPTGTPGEYVLTDNSTGGTTSYFYSGSGSAVPLLPNASATYSYPFNGTFYYTYAVTDSTTLCMDTLYGTVVVTGMVPPANCSASFTLLQDSLNMSQYYCWNNSVNSTGGTSGLSYLWDFGDGYFSSQAYPTHTYSSLGTFTLCLTINDSVNGCTSTYCDSVLVTVKASGTTINVLAPGASIGLEEVAFVSNLSLFPNPTEGVFKLRMNSKVNTSVALEIVSSTGQVVFVGEEMLNEGMNEIQVNQSELSEGLYLIKLKDESSGRLETIRFMKR